MGKIFKNMLPYWKWILVIVAFLVMGADSEFQDAYMEGQQDSPLHPCSGKAKQLRRLAVC